VNHDEYHQQQQEQQQMDEFTVTVMQREYRCVTSGDGSDFLIEACFDDAGREIEADLDIYDAAMIERIERLITAADILGDNA